MIDVNVIREALSRNKAKREEHKNLEFIRFTDDYKDIPRGTAIFKDFIVWGYPHIGRIFQLSTGIKEQFEKPFWVEEKVDGYNVRVFRYKDDVYALTRGGFICNFTTDRLQDFIDLKFFEDNPDLVLCMEVAGPENPYVEESPEYIKEDIRFFLFDIMKKGERKFLPYREKVELINKYGLPSVKQYGLFGVSDDKKLKELLKKLNEERREGVVLKEDSERDKRVKYITLWANLNDIKVTSLNILGVPADYYINRLLRLALFIDEERIQVNKALYGDLGKAFLDGLLQACEMAKKEYKVYRTFRCRFRKKENALMFLEQIKYASSHIQIIQRQLVQEVDYYILEFDKVYSNMTGMLGHVLKGGSVFD